LGLPTIAARRPSRRNRDFWRTRSGGELKAQLFKRSRGFFFRYKFNVFFGVVERGLESRGEAEDFFSQPPDL